MTEQANPQNTNNQNDATSQQADPNASVNADMLGNEHPSGQGVNVGSGYIDGNPSGSDIPEAVTDAQNSGKEFISTGTGDPAAGVIVDPQQNQQQSGEDQNTSTSSGS